MVLQIDCQLGSAIEIILIIMPVISRRFSTCILRYFLDMVSSFWTNPAEHVYTQIIVFKCTQSCLLLLSVIRTVSFNNVRKFFLLIYYIQCYNVLFLAFCQANIYKVFHILCEFLLTNPDENFLLPVYNEMVIAGFFDVSNPYLLPNIISLTNYILLTFDFSHALMYYSLAQVLPTVSLFLPRR